MISKFFSWLGQLIARFFIWLGNFLWVAFKAVLDALSTVLDYIYDQIIHFGALAFEAVMHLLPDNVMQGQNFQGALAFLRGSWNTFDDFVPLSEGLTFVTIFFTFYISVKIISFAVRVILALLP